MDIQQLFKEQDKLQEDVKNLINDFVKRTKVTRIEINFEWKSITKVGGSRKEYALTDVEARIII